MNAARSLRSRVALPLAAWILSLAGLGWLVRGVVAAAGEWVCPLDDAYIHLDFARTLAESGTWGVNPGEFASATSSPLWTALLAGGFAVAGPTVGAARILLPRHFADDAVDANGGDRNVTLRSVVVRP